MEREPPPPWWEKSDAFFALRWNIHSFFPGHGNSGRKGHDIRRGESWMVNNICLNGIAGLTWLRREWIVRGYWGWWRRHDSGFRFRHEKDHAILGRLERRHRFLVRHVLQVLVALLESKESSFYLSSRLHDTTLHTREPQLDTVEMQFNFIGARLGASFLLFLWLPCLMTGVGLRN